MLWFTIFWSSSWRRKLGVLSRRDRELEEPGGERPRIVPLGFRVWWVYLGGLQTGKGRRGDAEEGRWKISVGV